MDYIRCPNCGKDNYIGNDFCMNCGYAIKYIRPKDPTAEQNTGVAKIATGENNIATVLRTIGQLELVSSVVLMLIGFNYTEYSIFIGIIILWAGVVSWLTFSGFAEIIKLLQKNANHNELILEQLEKVSNALAQDKKDTE